MVILSSNKITDMPCLRDIFFAETDDVRGYFVGFPFSELLFRFGAYAYISPTNGALQAPLLMPVPALHYLLSKLSKRLLPGYHYDRLRKRTLTVYGVASPVGILRPWDLGGRGRCSLS